MQAGLEIQCPACGRLNDVPRFSDMGTLDDDGTFKLGGETPEVERERLTKLRRVYSPTRVDDQGIEIDLRNRPEELEIALADDLPAEHNDRGDVNRPRYDPETGELLRAHDISRTDDAPTLQAALPVMAYASGETSRKFAGHIWLRLFQPPNMIVMIMVLLMYIASAIWQFLFTPVAWLLNFPPYFINLLLPFIAAHYVCVVNEVAVADADELPRPLRNVSFTEDILNPFINFLFATLICYTPTFLVHLASASGKEWLPTVATFMLGSFFFPGVLMTLATTGGFENLRPDRLLRVIRLTILPYLFVVALWIVVAGITLWGLAGARAIPIPAVQHMLYSRKVMSFSVGPLMLTHIYIAHLAAWTLGLLYRRHHAVFGWAYQQHTRRELGAAAKRRGEAIQKAAARKRATRGAA